MLELSDEITGFLLTETVFTTVMGDRLAPVVSSADETYPFANYVIREQTGQSLDGDAYSVALLFYFEQNSYRKCVAFLDQMKPIIKEKYDWLNSEVEFVEVDQSFVGIINFNVNDFFGGNSYTTPDNPVVVCDLPVMTPFVENQFTNSYFITKGVDTFLQIQASNNPFLYGYMISFLTDVEGISLNAQTGLFTINYTGVEEVIRLNYSAENSCGTATGSVNLSPVDTDVMTLLPPIELVANDFNRPGLGPSFNLAAIFLPYMAGTIAKVEFWKDNALYITFQGANLNNFLGISGGTVQLLQYGSTYEFKIRVGNSLGEYSVFSEVLNVTIPTP